MDNVKEKIALITGALGGIGLNLAKEFLRNGAKGIILLDLADTKSQEVLQDLEENFGSNKAIFIKTDITKSNEVECAFQNGLKHFKNLDIVVNCAGVEGEPNFTLEDTININYVAAYKIMLMAMQTYLPKCKSGNEGLVINIASVLGLDPLFLCPTYSSTKSAIITLGRTLGTDYYYKINKVKIITICPGLISTDMIQRSLDRKDDYSVTFKKSIEGIVPLTPKDLAKMITVAINNGKNGSIWACEGGSEPYQIKFHPRQDGTKQKH